VPEGRKHVRRPRNHIVVAYMYVLVAPLAAHITLDQ
jgi:hypothetical protein